jgi:hypothetical protein
VILTGLISVLGGGLLRQVPEVLKFFDRKGERSHELAMLDKTYALDKLHAEQGLQLAQLQASAAHDAGETDLMRVALEAQGRPSGVAWIDGLSAFVRPFLTLYWCVGLYSAVILARWTMLHHAGLSPAQALLSLWGVSEQEIVFAMIGFWFADRAIRQGHTTVK